MQQFELNGKTLLLDIVDNINRGVISSLLPNEKVWCEKGWARFLATTDTITEEQAAELVESLEGDLGEYTNSQHRGYIVKFYKDYNHTGKLSNWLPAAKESFQSWLTANGISGNNAILITQ